MIFDAHSDILYDVAARRERGEEGVLERRHLPRLRKGGTEGLMLALWMEPGEPDKWGRTERMMAAAGAEFARCAALRPVTTVRQAEEARRDGALYAFLGVEGLDAIGEDLEKLEAYYAFGCRTAMLTWNNANALAGGAAAQELGLTPLGRRAVRRMQELGMAVDVSHLSQRGFWDVLGETAGPVIASHSNARALCDVPRNLTDEQLRAVAKTGGVVGLNAFHGFVDRERGRQTAQRLARHALHMIEVCGAEHVGCGFDFCEFLPSEAGEPPTVGLESSAEAGGFLEHLRRAGLGEAEVEAVARGNFLRVLGQVL